MEILTTEQFTNRINNAVKLERCPECGHSVEIIIKISEYGANYLYIKCDKCGTRSQKEMINEQIFDEETKKLATPITINRISTALNMACDKWNSNEENIREILKQNEVEYIKKRECLLSLEQIEIRCDILQKEIASCDSADLRKEFEGEKQKLERTILRIQKVIEKLPDITQRTILTLKYIGESRNGKRVRLKHLWQIANKIGYSEETIKKMHSKAIKNLEIRDII